MKKLQVAKILAVAIASFMVVASYTFASVSIDGSGSTFIYPVLTKWTEAYGKIDPQAHFSYQAVGSLQGVDQFLSHSVAFAASDAPLHLEQMKVPACGTLYFPSVVGAVVAVYNLPKLRNSSRLKLTGPVLADIYLGKIRTWNDPSITALNPDLQLPHSRIIVVYRSDGSGTTYTFTDYLSKTSSEWATRVGAEMNPLWPVGLSAAGNEGVADAVKDQAGTIGYVELSYAITKNLSYASLRNRSGAWVDPTPESIRAAADSLADGMRDDLQQSITDAPASSAYPISSYSYLLFFKKQKDPNVANSFAGFVKWILHDGQTYAATLHYAPLPDKVAERVNVQLSQIKIASESSETVASCKASLGLAKHGAAPPVRLDPDTAASVFSD